MKKNDRSFEDALMCAEKAGKHSHITKEKYLTETADLFSKWKKYAVGVAGQSKNETPVFITDGVMDPEVWFKSGDRPLFVLKEAYGFFRGLRFGERSRLDFREDQKNVEKNISLGEGNACFSETIRSV